MKLDILAFGAHPDDVELGCSGTIYKHIKQGKKVGVVDLTQGELGTRGNKELRLTEAKNASKVLKLSFRDNLGFKDGFFDSSEENLMKVMKVIRTHRPEIIFSTSPDRHPDHGNAAALIKRATFLSGLKKIETPNLKEWRPKIVMSYIQDYYHSPDVVVDITQEFERKISAIKSFSSQFYDPGSTEPETPISSQDFFKFIEARARSFGRIIGTTFAEGFTVERAIGIDNLFNLR